MSIREWEPWLESYIPAKGRVALDIGGNLGQWATELSGRFDEVYSIEPAPASAKAIAALNLKNVTVLPVAAWLHSCKLPFAVRAGEGDHTDIECHSGHSAVICRDFHRDQFPINMIVDVKAEAMDDLFSYLDKVDFIKIDVEGSELPAIQGCTKIIEKCRPTIIVECHAQENAEWIRIWLTRCGYNIHAIHGPGYTPEHPHWLIHTWIVAEMCKPLHPQTYL